MPSNVAPIAGVDPAIPPGKIANDYVRGQLNDALALCGYAVSAGVQTSAGEPLPFADIGLIHGTAAKMGLLDSPSVSGTSSPSPSVAASEWIAFEQAYYRLAVAMSPVTAETLASTQATPPDANGRVSLRDRIFGNSPALRFTRWFALVTIIFGAFVVIAECRIALLGQDSEATFQWEKNILESLLPWVYGALGSCAYLLRSAHYFIYQRSFDLRRKPEYFNRVLLGAISGGAIVLFVNYLVGDDGTVLHLSSAALGFVAGYSTDFLFNAIERVVAAIFPKTSSDPNAQPQRAQKAVVKKPPPPPGGPGAGGAPDVPANADGDGNGVVQGKQRRPRKKAEQSPAGEGEAGGAGDH
jgi:hypothetical protein